jgi:amino acid adenylation domain-containing protein
MMTAFKLFGQTEGATLFMTLLSAFAVLLSRSTRQHDLLIGTTIANRNRSELEDIVGFFVNTLVLRADLSGNPTFRALVQRVRDVCLDAYAHQDVPFERLVEELQPERDMSRMPLVQVMFTLQNAPKDSWDMPGVRVERVDAEPTSTPFDLNVELWEGADGVSCTFVYNRDLFEHDTIARMADHFRTLLDTIVGGFDRRLADLEILPASERRALARWNDTSAPYPTDRLVHELFEEHVARAPDAVAVVAGDQQLTYRQLDDQADQLAAYLRDHGVGPDVVVGLCMHRSVEAIVAMLGILKAGGGYLPLDPAYPADRLAFMVRDAGAPIVITRFDLRSTLDTVGASVVCMDADWDRIVQHTPVCAPVVARPGSVAYVIYTSGSTGQPKGVVVQHGSLTPYTTALARRWNIRPADRVLQFASISFDVSVGEIFGSLAAGATLVLRSDDMIDSVERFLRVCEERALTVLNLPAAYWHEITHALANDQVSLGPSVRLVCFGGERPLPEQVRVWRAHASPRVGLINAYGPTEATITATMYDIVDTAADLAEDREVPIGTPLPNVRLYVVDVSGQQAAVGVPGELLIGGVQVARGYLKRPALTAERFVPDPFTSTPGARLYRTGDLVRFRADGKLEFLGRIDNQVKIRGYRIEIGEVEAAIARCRAIRDVAVVAREDSPGNRRLVAYILADVDAVSAHEIREFLKDQLPAYMIPAAFAVLSSLPLTTSGKIDRRRLPALADVVEPRQHSAAPPHTPTESALADIWKSVLNVQHIGLHDSFFDLGGHSLLATRVISRVREVFQVEFPLRSIFEAPTLSNLATAIDAQRSSTLTRLPGLTRRSREAYRVTAAIHPT